MVTEKKFWVEQNDEGKFYVTDGNNESQDFDTKEEAEEEMMQYAWGNKQL